MSSSNVHIDEPTIFKQFNSYVKAIEEYNGSDPLHPWYQYLLWIDSQFSINYKEDDIVDHILVTCLAKFEQCKRYYQDRRLIKIFIKYILFRAEGPHFYLSQMHRQGVGTHVADLYVNWAFTHVANGDFKNAELVYRQGFTSGAQPSHIISGEVKWYRDFMLKRDATDEILMDAEFVERHLNRLSTLHMDEHVVPPTKYSISLLDQTKLKAMCVPMAQNSAAASDTFDSPTITGNLNTSIVHSIQSSARKVRKTPLNRTSASRRLDIVEPHISPMPMTSSSESLFDKGIQLPPNFARKNRPQTEFNPKPFIEPAKADGQIIPKEYHYDKIMLCPAEDKAFSTEELQAYNWFKAKNTTNDFTKEQDKVWGSGPDVPIRYPASIFPRKSAPQSEWIVPRKRDEDVIPNEISKMNFRFSYDHGQHYPDDILEEFAIEELMYQRRLVKSEYEAAKQLSPRVDIGKLVKFTRNPDVVEMLKKLKDSDRVEDEDAGEELSGAVPKQVLGDETHRLNQLPVEKQQLVIPQATKRKSIDDTGFRELQNATCSTQMFNQFNLLQNDNFSTPKSAKIPKVDESIDVPNKKENETMPEADDAVSMQSVTSTTQNDLPPNDSKLNHEDTQKDNTVTSSKSIFQFEWEEENTEQFIFNETHAQNSPQITQQSESLPHVDEHSQRTDPIDVEFKMPQPVQPKTQPIEEYVDLDETIGRSIYVQAPEVDEEDNENDWAEVTAFLLNGQLQNEYQVDAVDLDETRNKIDTVLLDWKGLDPFDPEFRLDLLNQRGFIDEISGASNFKCDAVHIVQPLKPRATVTISGSSFLVRKIIGSGNFGKVFLGENKTTKKPVALKQQRPPNVWEYYICLELQSRIQKPVMRDAFMSIDSALIGNNSTVYVSKLSKYGTMLDVCNVVKRKTGKNGLDECIVIILAKQMMSMIRHLHAVHIIHADIKPDNFLLMEKLSANLDYDGIALQLIDFGQSIDLTQFPDNQLFFTKVNTQNFICTEMMNDLPWKYQFDLFCLASTIYTLVTGKYMEVTRRNNSDPYKTQKLPRYVNGAMWDEIFDTLINIPSAKQIPSLSLLEERLNGELRGLNQRRVTDSILKFNAALD